MAISLPDLFDDTIRIVDSMELLSLFGPEKIVRLDAVENSLEISQDEEEENIAESDARTEQIRLSICVEVDRRKRSLTNAYPFEVSSNGEELRCIFDGSIGQVSYLLSLLIQNSWPDGLLSDPHKLTEAEFVTARRAFEILAAVATAGFARGPSFHIGRSRGGAQNLIRHLRAAWSIILDGSVRQEPLDDAPQRANDDGVDAISFRPSRSGLPHQSIVFAQSAAGQDWRGKSVKGIVERFLRNWFDVYPVSPREYLMVVADLPSRNANFQSTQELGFIAHRLEAPSYVCTACTMLSAGSLDLDCAAQLNVPTEWVQTYLASRSIVA